MINKCTTILLLLSTKFVNLGYHSIWFKSWFASLEVSEIRFSLNLFSDELKIFKHRPFCRKFDLPLKPEKWVYYCFASAINKILESRLSFYMVRKLICQSLSQWKSFFSIVIYWRMKIYLRMKIQQTVAIVP